MIVALICLGARGNAYVLYDAMGGTCQGMAAVFPCRPWCRTALGGRKSSEEPSISLACIMYNVLFHVILFAYLLASLLFWLYMGLRQRWIFYLAHVLLGGGFGLQTFIPEL